LKIRLTQPQIELELGKNISTNALKLPDSQCEVHGCNHSKTARDDHIHKDGGEELEFWLVKEAESSEIYLSVSGGHLLADNYTL
jgi:hypothetical protein